MLQGLFLRIEIANRRASLETPAGAYRATL
jgi:hypothetical protein